MQARDLFGSLAQIHGLPGIPEWADWFCRQLEVHKAIVPLLGIGCDPALVKGTKSSYCRGSVRGWQSNTRISHNNRACRMAGDDFFPDVCKAADGRIDPQGFSIISKLAQLHSWPRTHAVSIRASV
jgi:hypothetical protein